MKGRGRGSAEHDALAAPGSANAEAIWLTAVRTYLTTPRSEAW